MAKIYTFKNLQDEVLSWLDESGNTGTTLTNVKNAIQQAHIARLTQQDWNFMLWPTPLTFTTTSGVQTYSLHSEFYKPYYFFNQTTSQYLIESNRRQLGPSGVRWNTDTGVKRFSLWGHQPVQNQPASASTVSVVSSSSSDTTQTVTIQGTDSTGSYKISEVITLTGTSTATSTKTFSNPILNITLSAACAGTVTVSCGATTLITYQIGEVARNYQTLYLLSAPNSADTVEYRFFRQPTNLVDDNDISDIPPPFSQILVWDVLITMAAYNTDVDQKNIAVWTANQQRLEQALMNWDEGNSLESEPRFVRSLDADDEGAIRINR